MSNATRCAAPRALLARVCLCVAPVAVAVSVAAAPISDQLAPVLNSENRSEADRERDQSSRPTTVLEFLEIRPGMRVLDLLAGDGYYSELLSHVVGPEGYVYLHNNQGYIGLQQQAVQRVYNKQLNNVELYVRELRDIMLPTASLDVVLLNLVYHDFYYRNNGWEVSVDQLFSVVHRVLKPGGVLAVIDHDAPAGSGPSYAQALHRIERDFAVADISARGFDLVEASETLHNPDDDLQTSVFNPDIRRHTSRFILKFVPIN